MVSRMFAVLMLLLGAIGVYAQGGMPGMFDMDKMQHAPVMVMARADVQKELKLDKEQSAEIKKIVKAHQDKLMGMGKSAGTDFAAAMGMMKELDKSSDESSAAIIALLKPEQAQRLLEVRIQIVGAKSLLFPEVVSALALDEDQVAQLKKVQGSEMSKMMSLMQSGNPRDAANKMKQIQTEIQTEMLAVLKPEQAAKFKELEGKPFAGAKKPKG